MDNDDVGCLAGLDQNRHGHQKGVAENLGEHSLVCTWVQAYVSMANLRRVRLHVLRSSAKNEVGVEGAWKWEVLVDIMIMMQSRASTNKRLSPCHASGEAVLYRPHSYFLTLT